MIATVLKCEYDHAPLCVVEPKPRLSWLPSSQCYGEMQAAYQVLVATTPERLTEADADLWNSGRVPTDASHLIEYGGKVLKPRQECWWSVRLWGSTDPEAEWSDSSIWEMGLLTNVDWSSSAWIGRYHEDSEVHPAPYLRTLFHAKESIRRARIYASGVGYAELSLNGEKIAPKTEREPGYTNFDRRVLYVVHDVTLSVRPGANALGAVLGTGWYDVHDIATWNFEKAAWRGQTALRLVLFIDYFDGSVETVTTNGSWKCATGPILRDGIYTGEIYDARLEMPGWAEAEFDDSSWTKADIMTGPRGKLTPRICPPVVISKDIAPIAVDEPQPAIYVADMGQNFSGHVRLRLTAPAGTTITMRYAEKLDSAGMLDQTNINFFMIDEEHKKLFQSDVYICKGGATEIWEQRFSYAGFQYVEITGLPRAPSDGDIVGRFAHTQLDDAGEFVCTNPMLNKLQEATRWAYLSNAQNIPTDCPQREKNGWTADAHLASEAGLMNFDSTTFYTKWLDDLYDSQMSDSRFPLIVPSGGWGSGECHPVWDSAYPIIMWDMYRYCGDKRVLEKNVPSISRYVDYLATRTTDGVINFDSLDDWVPWKTVTSSRLTSTAFFYHITSILADSARVLQKHNEARKYEVLADSTRDAYNARFLNRQTASYDNGSQTAQALSLYFGLVPEDVRSQVLANLITIVEANPQIDTGILGAKYLIRLLSEAGRADLAYAIITNPQQPSWAWWIEQGATTLWESWTGADSLNHIMFGDISNWMFQWIAGIGLDPASPGFKHFIIRPQIVGGITWARAHYQSVHGRIETWWTREAEYLELYLRVPCNTTATVYLPAASLDCITETYSKLTEHQYLAIIGFEHRHAILRVGSGDYLFRTG